jgi:septum formation protein
MKILLGSSSPRRKEILGRVLGPFEIRAPEADERVHPGESPARYAERVSLEKARTITARNRAGACGELLIIACDTIVTIDDRIIGKPESPGDALSILRSLAGRTHRVISALTLVHAGNETITRTGSEISEITFRNLCDRELSEYLDRIDYMDKAGAYAVQESGGMIIEKIEGSVTNVIGFPLRLFFRMLAQMGLLQCLLPDADESCAAAGAGN